MLDDAARVLRAQVLMLLFTLKRRDCERREDRRIDSMGSRAEGVGCKEKGRRKKYAKSDAIPGIPVAVGCRRMGEA